MKGEEGMKGPVHLIPVVDILETPNDTKSQTIPVAEVDFERAAALFRGRLERGSWAFLRKSNRSLQVAVRRSRSTRNVSKNVVSGVHSRFAEHARLPAGDKNRGN